MPAHIAILDQHFEIIAVNAAWRQLAVDHAPPLPGCGMSLSYLSVCADFRQMDLPESCVLEECLAELAAGEREMLEAEYRSGAQRFFVVRARRFRWHEDLRLIVSHDNITTLKRAQLQLHEERDRRAIKDRCLSMMSHELRSPLASIQLSHDLLAHYEGRLNAAERQQYLDNICHQIRELKDIVSDAVSLSKSESADLVFDPVGCDLVIFCRDVFASFQLNRPAALRLHFECASKEIVAHFDVKLLRRALGNLIGNAIKYSPAGGELRLRLWRDGELARISVSDEGIGIPPEDADRLFQAFQRASNVGSLPGAGLGLAIAKQALDLHGAAIDFSSALGLGTTFTVALPLRPPAQTRPAL